MGAREIDILKAHGDIFLFHWIHSFNYVKNANTKIFFSELDAEK